MVAVDLVNSWPLTQGSWIAVLAVFAEPSAYASCAVAPITLTACDNLGGQIRMNYPLEVGRCVVSSPRTENR